MEKVLNQYEKIKQAFEKYADSLNKTEERRLLWKTETKEKIYDTLKLIEESFKFDWHVQRLEDIDNYQTINICCNTKPSGLFQRFIDFETGKTTRSKSYMKNGAYLAYCQSFNGKINVIMKCPYIEEWVLEMDAEVIATVEPKEVTEDLISQHLIKFLNKLSEWEGMEKPPLGYKTQSYS